MMRASSRQAIRNVLKKHGYPESAFSDDLNVVLVYVGQRFGEGVAVHPESGGKYTLWVRWRGRESREHVIKLAEALGGYREEAAVAFRGLNLAGVDREVGRVLGWLENEAEQG